MKTKAQKVTEHLTALGYAKGGAKDGTIKVTAKAERKTKGASNRMTEEELIEDYPHVVAGSLSFIETENKQAVEILCSTEGCEHTRKVRTSDLWQVEKCQACTRKDRRERARDRRKAKKADKVELDGLALDAEKVEAPAEPVKG